MPHTAPLTQGWKRHRPPLVGADTSRVLEPVRWVRCSLVALHGDPTARSFRGSAITVGTGEDDERRGDVVRLARRVDASAEAHPTGIGWGGDSHAVTLVLEGLVLVGGVAGGVDYGIRGARLAAKKIVDIWNRLRSASLTPHFSIGAITLLCMADLHERLGGAVDDIGLVSAFDLAGPNSATQGFSGAGDPYLLIFSRADCSWLYLVTSVGQILNFSQGEPLPSDPYSFGWMPPDTECRPDRGPFLYDWANEAPA